MPVTKEYLCISCGPVENTLPVCPRCGNTEPNLKREFRSPVGIKSGMTTWKDTNIRGLVEGAGMGDFSNNVSTKHERDTSDTWKDKKEYINMIKSGQAVPGGVKVEETRNALRKIGKVTKIYHGPELAKGV